VKSSLISEKESVVVGHSKQPISNNLVLEIIFSLELLHITKCFRSIIKRNHKVDYFEYTLNFEGKIRWRDPF